MKRIFGVIGGDRRQAELARLLASDGNEVLTYGLEKWCSGEALDRVTAAETVILPLPLCKEGGVLNCEERGIPTLELFRGLRPEQRILAGQVKPEQRMEAESCGLKLEDYFRREELTVANAAITAEAAVQVAMERLERTLLGMDCLVLGFGRIGKLLCHRLQGMGAHITAAARKPEALAWIRAYGWNDLHMNCLDGNLSSFGAVFNTVPSLILDEKLLSQLPAGRCLCIDLASQQGIDLEAAGRLGLPNVWATSLPGRLAPETAAAVIRDTIYDILLEG